MTSSLKNLVYSKRISGFFDEISKFFFFEVRIFDFWIEFRFSKTFSDNFMKTLFCKKSTQFKDKTNPIQSEVNPDPVI